MFVKRTAIISAILLAGLSVANAQNQKKYGPGVTDTEIKIGRTAPLSGPGSVYATGAHTSAAYFAMINEKGGINGRKINVIIVDDALSPPKTVEQTRRLVEQDEVLLTFASNGTAANSAIQKYLNDKNIPQLMIGTGASKFNDPSKYPWTLVGIPIYKTEGKIFAKYILANKPGAKIGLLYQNDDFGKDYLAGLKEGLGEAGAKQLVSTLSYEMSDPTIDSQIVTLRSQGADVLVIAAVAKFVTQAIRRVGEMGWKPTILVNGPSSSIPTVLIPAGVEHSTGVITSAFVKDPGDPRWTQDPDFLAYKDMMNRYYSKGDIRDFTNVIAYAQSVLLAKAFAAAGNDLSPENILRQVTKLDEAPPMFLPGLRFTVTPTDYDPVKKLQLQRFDGQKWEPLGEPVGG